VIQFSPPKNAYSGQISAFLHRRHDEKRKKSDAVEKISDTLQTLGLRVGALS
jgi:hypothetical protein